MPRKGKKPRHRLSQGQYKKQCLEKDRLSLRGARCKAEIKVAEHNLNVVKDEIKILENECQTRLNQGISESKCCSINTSASIAKRLDKQELHEEVIAKNTTYLSLLDKGW
jgi:hypothetical protein